MRNFMLHLTVFLPAKSWKHAKRFREFIPCGDHLSRLDSFGLQSPTENENIER
jgi:hypothetical protein